LLRIVRKHRVVRGYEGGAVGRFENAPVGGVQSVRQSVAERMRERECVGWQSLPGRFARLILSCTRERQNERWDVSQVLAELERLAEAERAPGDVGSAELLAEELARKSTLGKGYEWDSNRLAARLTLPSGCEVDVIGDESNRDVLVEMTWTSLGTEHWKNVSKYLPEASKRAGARLRNGGWKIRTIDAERASGHVLAGVHVSEVWANLTRLVVGLDEAARCFEFS